MSTSARRNVWPLVLVVLAGAWLYSSVVAGLVRDWFHDENYSHGFLVLPLAGYFVWERRARLRALRPRPGPVGLIVVLASLATLVAGILGAEFFLSRISLIGVIAGTVLFLAGWDWLRVLAFPIAFLLLMVPIPAIVFNQIAFPLQLFASRFGVSAIELCGVPVLREGNVIILANTTLEVAEACSGIRSLVSLLTLGLVYGYFADSRWWVRAVIAASTIPIAIVANGLRVAGTGVLAHYLGPDVAQGFFHTFSGWLVFLSAFALVAAVVHSLHHFVPEPTPLLPRGETSA
jgi:exosortase